MTEVDFGDLESVDLREAWSHEAQGFTSTGWRRSLAFHWTSQAGDKPPRYIFLPPCGLKFFEVTFVEQPRIKCARESRTQRMVRGSPTLRPWIPAPYRGTGHAFDRRSISVECQGYSG